MIFQYLVNYNIANCDFEIITVLYLIAQFEICDVLIFSLASLNETKNKTKTK